MAGPGAGADWGVTTPPDDCGYSKTSTSTTTVNLPPLRYLATTDDPVIDLLVLVAMASGL
jgi:hypothetical protein